MNQATAAATDALEAHRSDCVQCRVKPGGCEVGERLLYELDKAMLISIFS